MKTKSILLLTFICFFCGLLGWQLRRSVEPEQKIPSIREIQVMIGCEKIDGIIGPETRRKWDRAICNQAAEQWFDAESYQYIYMHTEGE